jgi:hypothetical protein
VVRYCSSSLGWLETLSARRWIALLRTLPAARALPKQGDRWRRAARPCLRSRLPMSARDGARFCLCPTPRALSTIRLQQNGMGLRCVQGRVRFGRAKGVVRRGGSRRNGAQIDLRVDWFTGIRNRVGLSREVQHLLPPHVHLVGCTVQLLRPTCVITRRKAFGSIGATLKHMYWCLVVVATSKARPDRPRRRRRSTDSKTSRARSGRRDKLSPTITKHVAVAED